MSAPAFDLSFHHEMVMRRGEQVLHARAQRCPCGSPDEPQRADPTCAVCRGWGWKYGAEAPLTGLVVGMRSEKVLIASGIAEPGDLVLSLSPLDTTPVADWDRIRLTWAEGQPYEGDVLTRAQYGPDRLMYEPSTVYRVFAVHPVTGDETDYVAPTDYSITGRDLVWVLGRGPGVGRNYSVVYSVKSFDWMVFTMPMQRFERGRNLGTKVLLRRRHAVSKVPF